MTSFRHIIIGTLLAFVHLANKLDRFSWGFSSSVSTNARQGTKTLHTPLLAISLGTTRSKQKKGPASQKIDRAIQLNDRFDRTASNKAATEHACILTIHATDYNLTAWANAHPGGASVLKKFNGKNATKAFESVGHSLNAYEMLKDFAIHSKEDNATANAFPFALTSNIDNNSSNENSVVSSGLMSRLSRSKTKLFTKEDPGLHKYCGIFVLLHFMYRFAHTWVGDPSAGFGNRMGRGPNIAVMACIIPHTLLSLSSLIFHTVPRERVIGKPMIWQEFRMHNIIFAIRSIVCVVLAWLSIYHGHAKNWRRVAVVGSSLSVLVANWGADVATDRLRHDTFESTTATMPYWEGCGIDTQRRFKSFYAYSQFLATLACMAVCNPAWPLVVLLPIQLASLLMTLVRKGIISTKGYHMWYTAALVMPYVTALRSMIYMKSPEVLLIFSIGLAMFQLRRKGVNKYSLWGTAAAARILVGDRYMNWSKW